MLAAAPQQRINMTFGAIHDRITTMRAHIRISNHDGLDQP
jgi:hypothetical protein